MFILSTVLSFEALGRVSELFIPMTNTNISVALESLSTGEKEFFNVYESNANEIQQKMLQKVPTQIRMYAHGRGIAFVEIECGYNKEVSNVGKNYELMVTAELAFDEKSITIHIAARAMPENPNADVLGVTSLIVELPSGFEFKNEEQIYHDLISFGVKVRRLNLFINILSFICHSLDFRKLSLSMGKTLQNCILIR